MTAISSDRRWPDSVTVVAIAAIAYVTASLVHEAIGHAGAGLLVGVRPAIIASTHVVPASVPAAAWQRAATAGAGSLANLAAGLVAWGLGRLAIAPWWRYFLWLSASVNIFFCGSYVAASSLFAFGDWTDVENELRIGQIGRVAIAIAGVLLCRTALRIAQRKLDPFLPEDSGERLRTARTLSRTAWIAGTIVIAAAGLAGARQVDLPYALAWTLGGTCWLAFVPKGVGGSGRSHDVLALPRSRAWIAAGAVTAILYIALLGPGLHFGPAA